MAFGKGGNKAPGGKGLFGRSAERKQKVPELSPEDKDFVQIALSIFKYEMPDKQIGDPNGFGRYVISRLTPEERNQVLHEMNVERKFDFAKKILPKLLDSYERGEVSPPTPAPVAGELLTSRHLPRRQPERRAVDPETQDRRASAQAFGEQIHTEADVLLEKISGEIVVAEQLINKNPSTRLLEKLETLRLTHRLLTESRDAQKELDDETRFLYEGVFASFTSKKHKEERYQRKGTGGIELMLDAVRHARSEVRRLQEEEPDPTKRSKLIPKPVEEHQLKTWQNRISQGIRIVLGPTSGVLDTGVVVGLYLGNVMARTGQIVQWTDPVYAVTMAVGLGTVGVTLENMKRTAATDDLVRSPEYLSEREKKAVGKQKMSWKQMRALLATGAYTLMQFEGVLVAVAGAQQGGDLNRELATAAQSVDRQIDQLKLPAGFDAADFDDEHASQASYQRLNQTGRFFVDMRRKFSSIIEAEAGGHHVAGAGGREGSAGLGRNWGGKYAILNGTTTVEGTLLPSAPGGLQDGMQARHRIQEEFRTRLAALDLDASPTEHLDARANAYHEIAEEIVRRHFNAETAVLQDGVSAETQIMAFYNDFVQALDDPAFVILNDSNQPQTTAQMAETIAHILQEDTEFHRLSEQDRQLLVQMQTQGGERISLRELYVLYKTGAIETGARVATWSDDVFDPIRAKISQSFGVTPPNRSTLRPHILNIQDTVPLYEYLQNKMFAERSNILIELLQNELRHFDDPNAPAGSGISLTVPHLSIDVTPFDSEHVHTDGGATWFSMDTHYEAFKTWERAGMSMGVLAILLLLNFSSTALTRMRVQKTEKTRRDEFSERRQQFEGEGNREEGSEYLLAEHISENLNKLVSSIALKGIFPTVTFTPDMVQAAMREAAATDEVPVLANSPFSSPKSILGKLFGGMSKYPHDLKHVFIATDLPVPPAVKAFNHLVTLYKDPVALTTRVADQLLPGFAEMMETVLENPEFVRRAMLPSDQFKLTVQRATPEEQEEAAALRAKILMRVHEVNVGHHAFAKRYAQTKIEHLTNDAFDELYGELAEVSEELRGKYLDLTKNPINLIEDNIDAFDANNPGMLETMRESGLRQTIASALERELAEANALITLADEETARITQEEALDLGLFGKEAGRIIKSEQDKRTAKIRGLTQVFTENSDPHIRQFSSTTAIKEQVFQDVRKNVLEEWYTSENQQQRTKNWAGIPVKEQLKAIQEAVRQEGAYLVNELLADRANTKIDALGAGGPFEGVTIKVAIESRKKQRRTFSSKNTPQTDVSADEGVPQIQVDRHVVTFSFNDRDGKEIFKIPVEIRNTLSKVMKKEEIESKISQWIRNRKDYFSARVLLDSIDEKAHDVQKENEREIQGIQQRLARIGFTTPKPKNGETYDFAAVDLSKKGSQTAVRAYLTELLPRLARRTVISDILGKRNAHERYVEQSLAPAFASGKISNNVRERTTTRLNTVARLYANLTYELRPDGETPGTLTGRVQKELVSNMESIVSVIENSRRELKRLNVSVSFIPRSPEYVTVARGRGIVSRAFGNNAPETERIKVNDLLEYVKAKRPSAREFAEYLRRGTAEKARTEAPRTRRAA